MHLATDGKEDQERQRLLLATHHVVNRLCIDTGT